MHNNLKTAHDFRNVLANIKGLTDLLQDEITAKISDETTLYLKLIQDQCNFGIQVSEDIMNKDSSDLCDVPLNAMLQKQYDVYKLNAKRKEIVLKNKVNSTASIAYTNPFKLNRILNNLIQNAIKFTPNSGFIELDLQENDTHFIISIADTGSGFKAIPNKKKIELNNNASSYSTINEKGWGLGLQICQDLASEINAEITYETKENIGTTFFIRLKKTVSYCEIA